MQFDKEFISKLGKKSISKDFNLTRERVNQAWSSATKEKQSQVLHFANVPYSTAYRVRKTGAITTKMTIAYSQVLDINPYYLIGDVDQNTGYSYESAKKLLIEVGSGKFVKAFEKRYVPPETDTVQAEISQPDSEKEPKPSDQPINELSPQAAVQRLSEEDMMILLKGLVIKVGAGKPQAIADINKITEILIG